MNLSLGYSNTYELSQMRIHRDILLIIMSEFCTQTICFELLTIFVHPKEIYKVQKNDTQKICTAFCQILLEVISCALIGLLPSSVQGECTTLQQCAM